MNNYITIIVLIVLLILFFYFRNKKLLKQYFSISTTKPKVIIQKKDTLLWINPDLKNIEFNIKNLNIDFLPTSMISYTNRSINSEMDFFQGFYFKLDDNLSDLKIGLHNARLEDFQKPLTKINFCFSFISNRQFQIEETYNPYLENDSPINNQIIVNIDYCQNRNKKLCSKTKNTVKYDKDQAFVILIHENMINYILISKRGDSYSALLLHQSTNKILYPLYPVILNTKNKNSFSDFKWCSSGLTPPPTDYSVELLNPVKYGMIPLPPQESLQRYAPQPSTTDLHSDTPAPAPETQLFPWDRKIKIIHAVLNVDTKILNIFVKTFNINTLFLERLYGVNILLAIPNKKNKNLSIPYIPVLSKNNLTLDSDNIVNMNVYVGDHLNYFYQKNIQVKVVLRLGEFTSQNNIVSESFTLDF